MVRNVKKIFIRIYQKIIYIASFFLNFNEPIIIKGKNCFHDLAIILDHYNKSKALIVTDEGLHKLKMDAMIYEIFDDQCFKYALYYNISANPSITQIEEGVKVYKENKCDCIVVIGGGSAIDAAKIIGARVSNPKKSIRKMKGLLKVTRKLPLMMAIPTTAGTGSEATVAAVVSNKETKEKFPIEDPKLIPAFAILNPKVLVNLPPHITSTTGMDALTHAIEAYIGKANTKKTAHSAILATQLIFKYLKYSYDNPLDLEAREKMQIASYHAGVAFTRAYVGYVHAIAHTLGGFYNVPHGLANAIILPIVLRQYGKKAYKPLARLYECVTLDTSLSTKEKALKFIEMIEELNKSLDIPNSLKEVIIDEDIPIMIKRAMKEAIPLYPTPTIWKYKDFEKIFKILQK